MRTASHGYNNMYNCHATSMVWSWSCYAHRLHLYDFKLLMLHSEEEVEISSMRRCVCVLEHEGTAGGKLQQAKEITV